MSKTRVLVEIEVSGPEFISEEHILGVIQQHLMMCYGAPYKTRTRIVKNETPPSDYDFVRDAGLTLRDLRRANMLRVGHFKNVHGDLAHPPPHSNGSNWSVLEWLGATAGELGEAANVAKKMHRGDLMREDAVPMLAQEISDTITYLDLTAMQLGISLDHAVAGTFNRVSERVGSPVRFVLHQDGYILHVDNAD